MNTRALTLEQAMARRTALVLLLGCLLLAAPWRACADDDEPEDDGIVLVTCGSVIKLEAEKTRHVLHSHEVSYGYGRGSGQQSVTGFPEKDSAASLWVVRAADCAQGSPIRNGQEIKLQHVATRRWLHSHQFSSPLSNNQEVSCFGDDTTTDTGDLWRVEWDAREDKHWERDAAVRLLHKDTAMYLSNHNVKFQRPIPGHTEVFGFKQKGPHAMWRATEGVYFPPRTEGTAEA